MARIKPQALLQQSKKKKGPSGIGAGTVAMYGLIAVVMAITLFASHRYWNTRARFQAEDMISDVEHDGSHVDLMKADLPKYAVINTSKGSITVELYKEGSPEVVNEFVESCQKKQFKGMLFDRVIKNFVIQGGGDINGQENTEDWTSRGKHYNQLDTSLKHEAFMLGTSKTRKNGEIFNLFITTAPIPHLNEKINVFGRVIKGEDVVQEIEEADTDEHYRPKTQVGIVEVTLRQKL